MTNEAAILHPVEHAFRQFERQFEQTLQSDQPILKEVLHYLLSKRGKQLRPQLVLLAAQLCRGITDKTTDTAVALELLHTASLVHDDVVDSSPLRRGHEAVHIKWTNKVAILVGDYLLARVMQLIVQVRSARILNIVAEMSAALSSGELMQLHANSTMWITEEQYYRVIEQKTACLFAACLEAGAESSGATMRQATALREFGHHLGMCFQMKDDILDYSDSDEIGKPTMGDIRDGKATLPLLIALQRATPDEQQTIRQLAEDLCHQAPHIDVFQAEQELKTFVMRYDGIRYAYRQMQMHKEKAVEALSIFHDCDSKSSLLHLLDYTINRLQ
ncbi:MAG: polyprenyl synthetase family protein [Paludibacteraceae bacterium]|nr:polyprenyl synthetase family protein [Paludibacteraceae bacterium]